MMPVTALKSYFLFVSVATIILKKKLGLVSVLAYVQALWKSLSTKDKDKWDVETTAICSEKCMFLCKISSKISIR
jgi:hypothetical protein